MPHQNDAHLIACTLTQASPSQSEPSRAKPSQAEPSQANLEYQAQRTGA
ncbi:MAG: hypothetical protein H6729_01835 [Deltaproteobacteria bacterium]|nr:hypothetical protein [Deltaproteobacteria bacterium]